LVASKFSRRVTLQALVYTSVDRQSTVLKIEFRWLRVAIARVGVGSPRNSCAFDICIHYNGSGFLDSIDQTCASYQLLKMHGNVTKIEHGSMKELGIFILIAYEILFIGKYVCQM
jgi:hypothetical protein